MKLAEEQALVLEESLSGLMRATNGGNERCLMIALLRSTQRAYRHLCKGWISDSTYAAWACRNLFDLRVLTRFILGSTDNRRRFIYDRLTAVTEPQQLILPVHPSPATAGPLDLTTALDLIWERMKILGAEADEHLSTRKLAVQMGLAVEFEEMHALCAPLMHPFAWSILVTGVDAQESRDALLGHGCHYFTAALADAIPAAMNLNVEFRSEEPGVFSGQPLDEGSGRRHPHRTADELPRYSAMI